MALKVVVLIPAAGTSNRFRGEKKKQFSDLNGRAVFLRSIEMFADRQDVKRVIIAIPAEDEELFQVKWGANLGFYGVKHIIGGSHRCETINKLLSEVDDSDVDLIALHDAVRPCVTKEQIDAVFAAAAKTGAAILAGPLVGTIKQVDQDKNITKTIDRSKLWEAQTPQVFKPQIIRAAYQQLDKIDNSITDDAQLVESLGIPVKVVESDTGNVKITTGADLAIASAILKSRPQPKAKGPVGPWAGEQGW
jgi:2-C-methyl-D-erythritol 4-phosphate cytidylyltransferase